MSLVFKNVSYKNAASNHNLQIINITKCSTSEAVSTNWGCYWYGQACLWKDKWNTLTLNATSCKYSLFFSSPNTKPRISSVKRFSNNSLFSSKSLHFELSSSKMFHKWSHLSVLFIELDAAHSRFLSSLSSLFLYEVSHLNKLFERNHWEAQM